MRPVLTLLLAVLIAFAPVAPGEAGMGHAAQTQQGGQAHDDGHAHGLRPGEQAAGAIWSADCAPVVGHCLAKMAPPTGDVFAADLGVEADLTTHTDHVGQGIVLTGEPPPPRA